jgi:hypothetical protein
MASTPPVYRNGEFDMRRRLWAAVRRQLAPYLISHLFDALFLANQAIFSALTPRDVSGQGSVLFHQPSSQPAQAWITTCLQSRGCEARLVMERGMRAMGFGHASEAGDDARGLVFDGQAPTSVSGFLRSRSSAG